MTTTTTTTSTTTPIVVNTNTKIVLDADAQARIAALSAQAKTNLAAAMWSVMTSRASGISEQIARLMTDMATRNEQMKVLNKDIADAMQNKVENPDNTVNDTKQDILITGYKAQLDSLNSTQQLDMVKLQDMMSKTGETTSLLSSVLKLIADQNQGVVQKM